MPGADAPRLVSIEGSYQVQYRNRNLYNPQSPEKAAQRRAASYSFRPETLVIVCSPLLGYGIDTLLSNLSPGSHLLCVETDQQLMALSNSRAESWLMNHPSATWVRTDSPADLAAFVRARVGIGRFRRVVSVALNGGSALSRALYGEFEAVLQREIRVYWRNRMTSVHLGRLWVRNMLSNLGQLPTLATGAPVTAAGPVLVTGAGESIEAVLPLVAEYRARLLIICADTATKALAECGIAPDIVVALEAQPVNILDFLLPDRYRPAIAGDLTCFPGTFRRPPDSGTHRVFLSAFADLALIDRARNAFPEICMIPPLGSVGVAGAYHALRSGASTVLLAGLDFSFVSGKPHARGTPSHAFMLATSSRTRPGGRYGYSDPVAPETVIGKTGRKLATTPALVSYAESLRELCRLHTGDVRDIGREGLDLGIPTLQSDDELREFFEALPTVYEASQAPPATDASATSSAAAARQVGKRSEEVRRGAAARQVAPEPAPADQTVAERVATFLRDEERILETAIEAAHQAINAGVERISDEMWATVTSSIRAADYAYLDFPDPEPLPARSRNFLKRYLASAYDYLARLRRLTGRDS